MSEVENEPTKRRGRPPTDPKVEHLKEQAKAGDARKKSMAPLGKFYTSKNGKVLLKVVKPNGSYSTYMGKVAKMKDFITHCKKKGEWIDDHAVNEYESKLIAGE